MTGRIRPAGSKRAVASGLVILQLALLAALVIEPYGGWWPRNTVIWVATGIVVVGGLAIAVWGVVGLGSALTASPIPKERAPLVTHGIYGLVRNPIYTGLIFIGAGLALFGASWWHLVTWIVLLVVLTVKTFWEEHLLYETHPEFGEYAVRVGRFFPGLGTWPTTSIPWAKK